MARRYITVAVVFVVCFGLGYGATWLVVGSPDTPPAPVIADPSAPTREPTKAPEPTIAATSVATVAEADAVVAAPDAAPSVTDEEVAGEPAADVAVVEETQVAEPEAAEPAAASWWDACKGKVCIVDWGRVSGGISVREGRIEHGADVDWAADFGKAEKVGTLEAKKNMKVEVLGIGMSEGKPAAAWIKYKNITGVIALTFGDKSLSFQPIVE